MKNLFFLLAATLISQASFAKTNCPHQVVESTGTILVVPVYEAKATYFFDNLEKKSHAIVNWNLNPDISRECFKTLEAKYQGYTLKMAALRISTLTASVFKGKNVESLIIYPEAGGFYNGSTDMIHVDYNAKEEIKKAILSGKDLITINGPVFFDITTIERRQLMTLPCLGESTSKGVLGLHKRLGEIIKEIGQRNPEEKLNREDVLDQYMTSCVKFNEVDSKSLVNLESILVRKTILVDGAIPVFGNIKINEQVKVEAMGQQESTFLDY